MALDRYTRDILIGILITVITIIIANEWNQLIIQGINNYFKNNTEKAKLWRILYMLFITALAVFFVFWILPRIGFSLKQVSENERIKSKAQGSYSNGNGNADTNNVQIVDADVKVMF